MNCAAPIHHEVEGAPRGAMRGKVLSYRFVLVLMGNNLVVLTKDGQETLRRKIDDEPYYFAKGFGSGLVLLRYRLQEAVVSRFDPALELVSEEASPNGEVARDVWAPGAESTWFFALRSMNAELSNEVAELPIDGEPRQWLYPYRLDPFGGIVTNEQNPLFVGLCPTNGTVSVCAVRVDQATGALASVDIEVGQGMDWAWMAESDSGVLVLYARRESPPGQPPAISYHAVVLDPAGPTVVAGPEHVYTDPEARGAANGLVVLGDQAFSGGDKWLYRLDVESLGGWTRFELPLRPETVRDTYFGLAVIDDELYRYVAVESFGNEGAVVQKLIPPEP